MRLHEAVTAQAGCNTCDNAAVPWTGDGIEFSQLMRYFSLALATTAQRVVTTDRTSQRATTNVINAQTYFIENPANPPPDKKNRHQIKCLVAIISVTFKRLGLTASTTAVMPKDQDRILRLPDQRSGKRCRLHSRRGKPTCQPGERLLESRRSRRPIVLAVDFE